MQQAHDDTSHAAGAQRAHARRLASRDAVHGLQVQIGCDVRVSRKRVQALRRRAPVPPLALPAALAAASTSGLTPPCPNYGGQLRRQTARRRLTALREAHLKRFRDGHTASVDKDAARLWVRRAAAGVGVGELDCPPYVRRVRSCAGRQLSTGRQQGCQAERQRTRQRGARRGAGASRGPNCALASRAQQHSQRWRLPMPPRLSSHLRQHQRTPPLGAQPAWRLARWPGASRAEEGARVLQGHQGHGCVHQKHVPSAAL